MVARPTLVQRHEFLPDTLQVNEDHLGVSFPLLSFYFAIFCTDKLLWRAVNKE